MTLPDFIDGNKKPPTPNATGNKISPVPITSVPSDEDIFTSLSDDNILIKSVGIPTAKDLTLSRGTILFSSR